MQYIEYIGNSPKTSHNNPQIQVSHHTWWIFRIFYWREVKKQWIDEKCHQTREKENSVPLQENITSRIKNLFSFWLMTFWENFRIPKFKTPIWSSFTSTTITAFWPQQRCGNLVLWRLFFDIFRVIFLPGKLKVLLTIIIKPRNNQIFNQNCQKKNGNGNGKLNYWNWKVGITLLASPSCTPCL